MKNYGEYHPGRKNKIVLPSSMTRENIYKMYSNTLIDLNKKREEELMSIEGLKFKKIKEISLSIFKVYINRYFRSP
jgi:hypothetical protein